MSFPIQITFRHMLPSRVFEERIRRLAERLEKFSTRITSCHVVVEKPHQSRARGGLFDMHVSLCVLGFFFVVRRSHSAAPEQYNARIDLRDANNAAKRNLQE